MAKNYDELLDYTQGSDTGDDALESIQPISGAEFLSHLVIRRAPENNRRRLQRARGQVEALNYLANYDRALLLRSDLAFEFKPTSDGGSSYRLNGFGAGDLWIYPALTPGRQSGGRYKGGRVFTTQDGGWVPYAGVPLVNDLVLTCNSDFVGQRAYADGDTFDGGVGNPAKTLGANGIVVDLVADGGLAGGIGSFSVAWRGVPKRKATITFGSAAPATQLADVITFINTDLSSGGGYGLAHLFRATTTGTLTNAPPTFTGGQVQGQYDAEAYQVSLAQLASFFDIPDNQLREGEGLALAFVAGPVQTGAGAKGGRRQSLWDLPTNRTGGKAQNTTPTVGGNLFNTGREPEKIPLAVPIGKMLHGRFVFVDGTVLLAKAFLDGDGDTAITLGESSDTLARLARADANATCGAHLVGYVVAPGVAWANGDPINALTVVAALDEVIASLRGTGDNVAGSNRVGAAEVVGVASAGNLPHDAPAGSLFDQLGDLLNDPASATDGGGLNARVSEYGHQLHGKGALRKNYRETSPVNLSGGGARFIQAQLNPPTGASTYFSNAFKEESVLLQLTPFIYPDFNDPFDPPPIYGPALNEPIDLVGAGAGQVHLSDAKWDAPSVGGLTTNLGVGATEPHMVAELTATGDVATDGYYFVTGVAAGALLTLKNLDGSAPTFLSLNPGAQLHFHSPLILGMSAKGSRMRAHGIGDTLLTLHGFGHVVKGVDGLGALTHEYDLTFARWGIGNLFFGNDAARSTGNIPIGADKVLLDGVETANPVDATAGHHHGAAYSLTILPQTGSALQVGAGTDHDEVSTNFAAPTVIPVQTDVSLIPLGYVYKGVILEIYLHVAPISAGAMAYFQIQYGVVDGGIFWERGRVEGSFYATTTGVQQYNVQLHLPVYFPGGTASVALVRNGETNINASSINSFFVMNQVGSVVARA